MNDSYSGNLPEYPKNAVPIVYPVTLIVDPESSCQSNNNSMASLLEDNSLRLSLESSERNLFDCIQKACKALAEGRVEGYPAKDVQVRVAGGWVRDKVLGMKSDDVDIALDNCTGEEFANCLKTYMQLFEHETIGRIGVIAANPDQSKHLETATMKVCGIEVDFSNLRHEAYADDSRIPEIVIGTPVEDSYRRDFTINALYYNVHTNQVEDWTRRGLKDLLETRLVTTPLDAHHTFRDDPLRVLRAIRFAVRFGMELSDDLQEACMSTTIHQELHRKVSRERVGKELEGMLSGKHANPINALQLICRLNLAGSIFCLPAEDTIRGRLCSRNLEPFKCASEELSVLKADAWEESRKCIQILPSILRALRGDNNSNLTVFDPRLTYLAATILPFGKLEYEEKKKTKPIVEFMIREGIKFKNKDVIAVKTVFEHYEKMVQLLQVEPEVSKAVRLQTGLLLRDTREMWVTTLAIAAVTLIRQQEQVGEVSTFLERAQRWYSFIASDLNLDGCWKLKPILNGKELVELLEIPRGPIVGIYAQEQTEWILMNPEGTAEECREHLTMVKKKRENELPLSELQVAKKIHR
ncbi:unnamed protein product [Cylindrotheca closterium]|uniref:Poly A polymerase head domain-containing protein n=1 Tax=Cylindrotheca closterium TaxID=2856 RepID=A0AAD2FVH5_9STRA|nr:unnamed protein product [Cylindrotheca closterium]